MGTPKSLKVFEPENSPNWRYVPGYGDRYQVSIMGEVRGWYNQHGRCDRPHKLTPFIPWAKNSHSYTISLTAPHGRPKHLKLYWIVAQAWLPKKPTITSVLYHKNGNLLDDRAVNIGWIERSELNKMCACKSGTYSKAVALRRPVAKIDRDGNVLQIYKSAKDAGLGNYTGIRSVLDRCHHRIMNDEFKLLDGYTFRFMEEIDGDYIDD